MNIKYSLLSLENTVNINTKYIYYRYMPSHSRPSLTNQQSFFDSHTSPPQNSPKHYRPTLEHQESFVAPSTSKQDTFGSGGGANPFGFMPMRNILSDIERNNSKLNVSYTKIELNVTKILTA